MILCFGAEPIIQVIDVTDFFIIFLLTLLLGCLWFSSAGIVIVVEPIHRLFEEFLMICVMRFLFF